MLRNIVVGYDGSRSSRVAVEQALLFAEAFAGRLYIATVAPVSDADLETTAIEGETDIAEMAMAPRPPGEQADEMEGGPAEIRGIDDIQERCHQVNVACSEERLFGRHAGARLLRRSWLAELLVIGRGDERRPGVLGPNTTFLLSELVTPTLVCARQPIEVRSVLIPYKWSVSGGRALSFAAGMCEALNAELRVIVCERRRSDAHDTMERAEKFLRGYRVEFETDVSLTLPHEAVHSAAMERDASLVVIPGAHKRYFLFPWQRNETLWRALEVPRAAVLAYP